MQTEGCPGCRYSGTVKARAQLTDANRQVICELTLVNKALYQKITALAARRLQKPDQDDPSEMAGQGVRDAGYPCKSPLAAKHYIILHCCLDPVLK